VTRKATSPVGEITQKVAGVRYIHPRWRYLHLPVFPVLPFFCSFVQATERNGLTVECCGVEPEQGGVALASTSVAMSPTRFLAPSSSFFPSQIQRPNLATSCKEKRRRHASIHCIFLLLSALMRRRSCLNFDLHGCPSALNNWSSFKEMIIDQSVPSLIFSWWEHT